MKKCKVCLEIKSLSEFRFYKRATTSFHSKKCKVCLANEKKQWVATNFLKDNERNKEYNKKHADRIRGLKLVNNYWPTLTWQEAIAEWRRLFIEQNNHCALCLNTERLHVDHCHKTGAVRGLLCYNCNNGIGRLKDDIQILQNAINYLSKHNKAVK